MTKKDIIAWLIEYNLPIPSKKSLTKNGVIMWTERLLMSRISYAVIEKNDVRRNDASELLANFWRFIHGL